METDLSIYVNSTPCINFEFRYHRRYKKFCFLESIFFFSFFPFWKQLHQWIYINQSIPNISLKTIFLLSFEFGVKIIAAIFAFYVYFLIFNALLIFEVLTLTPLSIIFFWISYTNKVLSSFNISLIILNFSSSIFLFFLTQLLKIDPAFLRFLNILYI